MKRSAIRSKNDALRSPSTPGSDASRPQQSACSTSQAACSIRRSNSMGRPAARRRSARPPALSVFVERAAASAEPGLPGAADRLLAFRRESDKPPLLLAGGPAHWHWRSGSYAIAGVDCCRGSFAGGLGGGVSHGGHEFGADAIQRVHDLAGSIIDGVGPAPVLLADPVLHQQDSGSL